MVFHIVDATIAEMQAAMETRETSSRELVLAYMERIARYDKDGPRLNSVLELNPDALFIAEALDQERMNQSKGVRGPLHGIPILLKDNINTLDKMHTSAGSLALADSYASADAFLVKKLREAGAVILGKTNMTEFANFMTLGMPSGYSSRGGQVVNPYVADAEPGGSSSGSGVAVAASFCAAAVGTETSGSILNPSEANSIVGIKPTVGLISRTGVIPIANSRDTAGPMARTVADAATLLGAMTGDDPSDPATGTWLHAGSRRTDYRCFLQKDGLQGKRIGVPREYDFDPLSDEAMKLYDEALSVLREQGAVLVDPANVETIRQLKDYDVLQYEFKACINAYLASLGPNAPLRSLKEVIEFNLSHSEAALKYGQTLLEYAEKQTGGALTEPKYILARLRDLRLSQEEGIDATMNKYELDALVFPSVSGAAIAAKAGYPSIQVPAGYLANSVPFGITFTAQSYSEPTLISLAFAYEQASGKRVPPRLEK